MRADDAAAAKTITQAAEATVRAADPAAAVLANLPPAPPEGRVAVLALGKAALPMAAAVEAAWGDLDGRLTGLAVTHAATGSSLRLFEVIEASHPEPDARSEAAARRLLAAAEALGPEDTALVLISGGGSALACAPTAGVTLADKQALNAALLACGASIHEINAVRKRVSAIKGGRLAAAIHPAACVTLALSDVPGDDPAVIASGPTAPDPSTTGDALAVIRKYRLSGPDGPVLTPGGEGAPVRPETHQASFHMISADGVALSALSETPKPGDPVFARARCAVIASPAQALAEARAALAAAGWPVVSLGDEIEGDAATVGAAHAAEALRRAAAGERVALVSGGELTVVKTGAGRGGPNREYALALALGLDGHAGIWGFAMDTDGADGAPAPDGSPVGGAFVFPDTLARAAALGVDARARLADNDSGGFFAALGDDLRIGPTGTNVNDLRILLIAPAP